jgi:hypothetical protein
MAYLLASIPYFRCLVRHEYLRNLEDGPGEFCEATALAVMSVRGDILLHFQLVLHEPLAACAFVQPIEAGAPSSCAAGRWLATCSRSHRPASMWRTTRHSATAERGRLNDG